MLSSTYMIDTNLCTLSNDNSVLYILYVVRLNYYYIVHNFFYKFYIIISAPRMVTKSKITKRRVQNM